MQNRVNYSKESKKPQKSHFDKTKSKLISLKPLKMFLWFLWDVPLMFNEKNGGAPVAPQGWNECSLDHS
jgi:hypothetical protein